MLQQLTDLWFICAASIKTYRDSSKDDATSRSSTPSKDIPTTPITKELTKSRGSSVKPSTSSTNVVSKEISKTNSITDDDLHKRKRQRLDTSASSNESPEEKISKPEITITIPKDLKSRLVDDWHAINSQSKLIELPAKITVDDIVAQYKKSKSSSKGGISCEDISNGILVSSY